MDSGADAGTVQACVGDTDEVEQERTHTSDSGQRSTLVYMRSILLILNLRRSTLSNPLRPFQKYNFVPDAVGRREPVEQLRRGIQPRP